MAVGGGARVGCAGWSLPTATQVAFPSGDNHLARYAQRFPVAEINSSFHRPHRPSLYERWAASVPDGFRFSAKLPKTITHEQRLRDPRPALDEFMEQVAGLGHKLAVLLVQLPPSLAFEADVAARFFDELRATFGGRMAVEPRHVTWFEAEADALLRDAGAARVLADPVRFDSARAPGGDTSLVYLRLHGSPRMYYSSYEPALLAALALRLQEATAAGAEAWCIFDNTASGAAVGDALTLQRFLSDERG